MIILNFREKHFLRFLQKDRKHFYCSVKCSQSGLKTGRCVECSNCHKQVYRTGFQLDENSTGSYFCSDTCRSKFFRKKYCVDCVVCGKSFEKASAHQKLYPTHCCSVECRSKFNDKRKLIECQQCGKEMLRPPSLLVGKSNYFCGKHCHDRHQDLKTVVECLQCKKEFPKQQCLLNRSRNNFCSPGCRNKFRYKESFVETEFEKLLQPLGLPYERNNRTVLADPSDGRKCPELDFYLPTAKFAVEINGSIHYQPIYGEDRLAAQQVRDRKKRRRCKELGIILRTVKPGDCKRETYLLRYKRIISEIMRKTSGD